MARQKKAARPSRGRRVTVYTCSEIKAALARELRAHVKDRNLRNRLIEALGGEVAYGTGGGGGGVGVA